MPLDYKARRKTFIGDAQSSNTHHSYVIRRPAFMHPQSHSAVLRHAATNATADSEDPIQLASTSTHPDDEPSFAQLTGQQTSTSSQPRETLANPIAEKRRFELFIDLTWAGIIANIAEDFSHGAFEPESTISIGRAFTASIVLTLIAWRLWKFLQVFMSTYATNDIIERAFVVWFLILALIYGNNAPYFFAEKDQTDTAVIVYLIAKGSLLCLETAYAFFIPGLRKSVLLRWILTGPLSAFWIACFFVGYPTKAGFAITAVTLEFIAASIMTSPWLGHHFKLGGELHPEIDVDHWVERLRDFFIIILGEGVVNFIRNSPLGPGVTWKMGTGIIALAIFYFLVNIYFNGDQSRNYVHAVKRAWWRTDIWLFSHVIMFHCTLILGVAINFIIANPGINAVVPSEPEESSSTRLLQRATEAMAANTESQEIPVEEIMLRAKWTASTAFSVIIFCMTVQALLSRSLDKPGTAKIDNRYVRLAPRVLMIVVSVLLPLRKEMNGSSMLGILLTLIYICFMWEFIGSLAKGSEFVEK